MSVLYWITDELWIFFFMKIGNPFCTNIMVERVPYCAWTSNSLALTMFTVPNDWLIENPSELTNQSRNAMVLTYDL